ncbi:MAG: serine/threonine protein kinase, partial [Mycobacterium sp.]|nr:serine/threonine protein kinase [Mycobacterium sp.]
MIMVPEMFGPYEVQEPIGRGGMGEVHRAYDTVRQRTVALKRLRPELAGDERFRQRFLSECRRAAQLTEAHVIPIHDFGEIDGRLYLDMRLIQGDDLEKVLAAQGPLAPDRAVSVVTQVAAALDAAHAAGIVHRDVKPSNVLLATDGTALHCYLVDFGVAAAIGGSGSHTTTGTTVGTMDYIAPERLIGGTTDHRVDVYSLACLLYEALTGHPPFQADELPAMLHAHLNVEPPRPSEMVPDLPAGLDGVVARGMAKDPDTRYGSAGDLAAAAATALEGRSVGSHDAPVTVSAPISQVAAAATAASRGAVEGPPRRRLRARGLGARVVLVGLLALAIGAVAVGVNLLSSVEAMQIKTEPSTSDGDDPFTPSPKSPPPASPPPTAGGTSQPAPANTSVGTSTGGSDTGSPATIAPAPAVPVSGDTTGLYGGTGAEVCEPDRMATFLETHPSQGRAWAAAQGIRPGQIRAYLGTLTPVVLRVDTAVTNHGFRNGRAYALQSVQQAGTAVLVDQRGVPRVRCSCGNPLSPPTPRPARVRLHGAR